jgi:hypothetical protein
MKDEETTFKIIDACVPRGTTEKLAQSTSRTNESVNVWRRPRRMGVAGRNKFNPLDLVELIQDHAFAHAPLESHRIHQYLERRFKSFFASIYGEKRTPFTPEERDREVADLAKESSDVIEAVLCKATPENVRREAEELKRKIDEIVARIELGPKPPENKVIDMPRVATGGKS